MTDFGKKIKIQHGSGSHSSGSGTGRDFPLVFSWDWDGKRLIFVGVGRERFENSLPCHPLARTRPEITPPTTNNKTKKRKKVAFHDCMQRNGLIKALTFHKHLTVMKVCEHQVQRSHTFCRVYEFCMDKKMMTVQIMVIFCQLRLVSILSTLNQT